MRILIQNIHIFSTDGEESVLNFSESLTFVYGNVGAGKSTMLNLIMYGLGGSLTCTPAVRNCLKAVQLEVMLGDRPFRFFRMANSNRIQVDDISGKQRVNLLQKDVSAFLYRQFFLPDVYLSMGNIEDKKVTLSFNNFCWFSYLKQSEMDNSFFFLDSDNIYKQNAAINVLFSFFESEFLIDPKASQRYRDLKGRIRRYEEGQKVFEYLEPVFCGGVPDAGAPEAYAAQLKRRIADALSGSSSHTTASLASLLSMQKQLDQLTYKMSFDRKRKRYHQELASLKKEMDGITSAVRFEQSMENPYVQQLYDFFGDCLANIGFHGVSKFDTIRMDPKTYMPVLCNPYENREVSFETLGSGGKKTLFKICFALAVHRLQHAKPELNYLPSFLIIDTPMKNISEREDSVMYDKFYQYLFRLFSTELADTQLFVVDKEKRELSDYRFRENIVLMRMTRDEGMNPPLFKNYKGL